MFLDFKYMRTFCSKPSIIQSERLVIISFYVIA